MYAQNNFDSGLIVKDRTRTLEPRIGPLLEEGSINKFIVPEGQIKWRGQALRESRKGKLPSIITSVDDSNIADRVKSDDFRTGGYSFIWDEPGFSGDLAAYATISEWSDTSEPRNFEAIVKQGPQNGLGIRVMGADSNEETIRIDFYEGNLYYTKQNVIGGTSTSAKTAEVGSVSSDNWYYVSYKVVSSEEAEIVVKQVGKTPLFRTKIDTSVIDMINSVAMNKVSLDAEGNPTVSSNSSSYAPMNGVVDSIVLDRNTWYGNEQNIAITKGGWNFKQVSDGVFVYVDEEDEYVRYSESDDEWKLKRTAVDFEHWDRYNTEWSQGDLDNNLIAKDDSLQIDF